MYGDKPKSMERFCKNFEKLPDSVKSRLTVENDDKESMYSVKELYNGVYKRIEWVRTCSTIIITNRLCNKHLSERTLEHYINLVQRHYAQLSTIVRVVVKNDLTSQLDLVYPDYVYDYIDNYGSDIDIW